MIQQLHKMMNDAIDRAAPSPTSKPGLDEMADLAAAEVELELIEEEQHYPGDRQPTPIKVLVPAQDTTAIDVTDALQAEMDEWGEGSYVQCAHGKDARVCTSGGGLFVVDAQGNLVVGGRIMAKFEVELDTP